jgi:hypothetical protein
MKYLIFGIAALLAGECALAQTTAPAATPAPAAAAAPAAAPSEPAKKDIVTQPAPVKGTAAAKSVGTKDMTRNADAYMKAQEKKRAAAAKKYEAKGGEPNAKTKTAAADDAVRPGSLMTDEERTSHRKKLQSFKTLDECEKYQKDYQAKVEARAKEQHKTLRPFNEEACNRYKVAAGAAPTAGKAAPK